MKIARLTLTTTIVMLLAMTSINVYGENAPASDPVDTKVEADHKSLSCQAGCSGCAKGTCQRGHWRGCPVGACKDGSCQNCRQICPRHGRDCRHGCLNNQFGYGRMEICPGKTNGVCPVHGYGQCPDQRQPFGPAMRQALTPADRPYFGNQPLYVPREQYDPNFKPMFPRVRAMLVMPPAPRYMTTAPVEPMPVYTTRSPRDFLNPNPPNIGY